MIFAFSNPLASSICERHQTFPLWRTLLTHTLEMWVNWIPLQTYVYSNLAVHLCVHRNPLQIDSRRRLGRCIQWHDQARSLVKSYMASLSPNLQHLTALLSDQSVLAVTPAAESAPDTGDDTSHLLTNEDPTLLTRPSAYLRARCNLCFGGTYSPPRPGDDPFVKLKYSACLCS